MLFISMWPFTFYCIIRERDIQLNPNCQNILPDLTWLIFDLLVFRVTCKQLNSIVNCSYISFVFFSTEFVRGDHDIHRVLYIIAYFVFFSSSRPHSLSFSLFLDICVYSSLHMVCLSMLSFDASQKKTWNSSSVSADTFTIASSPPVGNTIFNT